MNRFIPFFVAALVLAGCATAPPSTPPDTPMQVAYKEAPPGWINAAPADALERGPWWTLFGDQQLNALAQRVQVSNQNIAASVAAYAQAQALVREQRASLFPQVGLDASASRSGGSGANTGNRHQLSLGASWAPDLWGRLRGSVAAAGARAEASAADLASARLSITGELAANYFSLRETDAERELLRATIEGYERSLQIARNRYDAGVVPRSDLLQAQTQLANAQADLAGLDRQRAQLEHAIAVLVGEAPGNFSLAPAAWRAEALPAVPLGLPSALLQRRPDVAAAERRMAAANAQIGVARAGYFPDIGLSASTGFSAARLADQFSANVWSLGLSLAQTVFDAGATRAQVDQARAAWEQAVAQYRQTVLEAFRDVEDQLAATRVLERQYALRRQASEAADQTEQQVMNRYRAGQVSYSEVVAAQASALSARRTLVQLTASRQTGAVALIQSLGGGWQADPRSPSP
ncbi:efflux transporter outer membrane subunit [Ideonella sp. BN130291]|uniref:efflux transporter outer membrane subunit n=1 Tax=Ideonella sp. BN130291 TaxID=3112940 RepID=UPI002E26F67B|nr:efflux transporter outer membrane subunit [Ideonella sp. BN130291]